MKKYSINPDSNSLLQFFAKKNKYFNGSLFLQRPVTVYISYDEYEKYILGIKRNVGNNVKFINDLFIGQTSILLNDNITVLNKFYYDMSFSMSYYLDYYRQYEQSRYYTPSLKYKVLPIFDGDTYDINSFSELVVFANKLISLIEKDSNGSAIFNFAFSSLTDVMHTTGFTIDVIKKALSVKEYPTHYEVSVILCFLYQLMYFRPVKVNIKGVL